MAESDEIIILSDDDEEEDPKRQQKGTTNHHQSTSESGTRQLPHKSSSANSTNGVCLKPKVLGTAQEKVRNVEALKTENAHLFNEFVDYCTKHTTEHPEVITFLKGRHEKTNPDYLSSTEFRNIIGRCLARVQSKKNKIYVYINELCTSLKANSQKKKVTVSHVPSQGKETAYTESCSKLFVTEPEVQDVSSMQDHTDAPEEEKQEKKSTGSKRQIRYLENLLKVYSDEIHKLQEKELDLDDLEDEDSTYIQENRLKKKMIKIFKKLCELKGCSSLTGRVIEQRIPYRGTRYPEINHKIEKFINRPDQFPDYQDILKVIQKVNDTSSLGLSAKQMQSMAQDAFREVGNRLQERRHLDLVYNFGSHLTDEYRPGSDPAMADISLERRLRENRAVSMNQLDAVIQKYANMQEDVENEEYEKKQQRTNVAVPSSSAGSAKANFDQMPMEEASSESKVEEANSVDRKSSRLEKAFSEKTSTKLKNTKGSDRETEGDEEAEDDEEDELSSDPDIEEELENSCLMSEEEEEEAHGDIKIETPDADQEPDNQSVHFGVYSGAEEVEDDDEEISENEGDSVDDDEIGLEMGPEEDLILDKDTCCTLSDIPDKDAQLQVKCESLDSGNHCIEAVANKVSLNSVSSSDETDGLKEYTLSETSVTIIKEVSVSLTRSSVVEKEVARRTSKTSSNGLNAVTPHINNSSETSSHFPEKSCRKHLSFPDAQDIENATSECSESSKSPLRMSQISANIQTSSLEDQTALSFPEASTRLRRSLSMDFSPSLVSEKSNTPRKNRLRKRSNSDSRNLSILSAPIKIETESFSENGGNIPIMTVNGRAVDSVAEKTPPRKKRKRSDGVSPSTGSDADPEDISLHLEVTCLGPDKTLVDVASSQDDSPFKNNVGSSSITASHRRHKVLKVNVATQCDPEEVIVLSDSD
ncbi:death domain-associated protein 6 [Protopterus annectens]|uniref:death domain-associated protein 6 n=1 Tax=Protopterus annectens TaxID=7888 RepID=UPI001CFA1DC4|nr:death domain-associated protein 6 [Protopterus annectens]